MGNLEINFLKEEGNRYEFNYRGYNCLIIRHKTMLYLCGFVAVNEDSIFFGSDPLNLDFKVHGSVTVGFPGLDNNWKEDLYYKPLTDETGKSLWWLGFDCGHTGDLTPIDLLLDSVLDMNDNRTYKNLEYVENELKYLVDQIIERSTT